MIRFPNRFAGMSPLRTHLHTVATDTSSSFATCFVVMYLFVIMNPTAIYTRSESGASGATPGSVALRSGMVVAGRMFPLLKMFPFVFPFRSDAKSSSSNGFQRCFQCFHIFRRVLKEK